MDILSGILIVLVFLLSGSITWWIIRKYNSWIESKQNIKDKPRKKDLNTTKSAISKLISGISFGNLIGGFLVILVGINLIPTIADQISDTPNGNQEDSTSKSSTILNLTTIFFTLGIMVAGISLAVGGLRGSGLM